MTNDLVKRFDRKGAFATYNLIDALSRNPTTIYAGADICAEAKSTILVQTARIEELEAVIDRQHKRAETLAEGWRIADDARIELEAKLAKAVETLEFYGDERNYEGKYIADQCGCCSSWYEPKIHKDGQDSGDAARAALAAIKENDNGN